MITMKEKTRLTMVLIKWLPISVFKEIISILPIMNTKSKKKLNLTEKRISKSSEDKQNNKNRVQAKMWKLSNKPWETSLITKEDKFKLFIQISSKEELPLNPQSLIISEDKLHNGKSGTATLNNSKEKKNKMKNKRTKSIIITKRLHNKNLKVEDTQYHLKDVWKSWKEWSAKTNKTKSTTSIVTIGNKVKNKEVLRANCCQYGV